MRESHRTRTNEARATRQKGTVTPEKGDLIGGTAGMGGGGGVEHRMDSTRAE